MLKLLVILLIGLVCEAIGVVFLNKGLREVGEVERVTVREVIAVIQRGVTNGKILCGVFFEAIFFACLLILMSRGEVSFIWPLTALGFVLTTGAAKIFLHEEVSPARWCGVFLIMCGAGLITWTEKMKETSAKGAPQVEGRATGAGN
jgi:uncharacterized membrane protein